MNKIGQSRGYLGRSIELLPTTGLPLLKNVRKPLVKIPLMGLDLTAAASTTDAVIHKKMFALGLNTLIISNEAVNDIMKIFKSVEESDLLIKELVK